MVNTVLKPLRTPEQPNLGQQAADLLRQAIVAGEFAAGTRLVEDDLAARLGVSRGPIRDALRQLEEEGLVETAKRGAFVAPPDLRDIWELYSLRRVLEGFALQLAVKNFTEEDVAAVQEIHESMVRAAAEGRMDDFVAQDMAFHSAFYERVNHRRLLRSWQALSRSFGTILGVTSVANPRVDSIIRKHFGILEGIKAGDAAEAERWLESHLDEAREVLETVFRAQGRAGVNR
jgi:GntR family transcriptional regulator, gluconate operon transcriptional repressor